MLACHGLNDARGPSERDEDAHEEQRETTGCNGVAHGDPSLVHIGGHRLKPASVCGTALSVNALR